MADTVDTQVLFAGTRRYVVKLTNISDGTGETSVTKVNKSSLTGPSGSAPSKLVVERIEYDVSGMNVRLFWDHTTPDEIAMLSGPGVMDWRSVGGLVDPGSAGGTGNIILTTNNQTVGDHYTITLYLRLKA